jgi:hypothetical protein
MAISGNDMCDERRCPNVPTFRCKTHHVSLCAVHAQAHEANGCEVFRPAKGVAAIDQFNARKNAQSR